MKKTLLLPLAAAMVALQSPATQAADVSNHNAQPTQTNARHNGWLGVYIRPMPHALAVQLSNLMPAGEGILVAQVEPNSPAAKAGIQSNDILLSLNDQKLYSPAQLTRLVASSPVGSKVKIEVIRKGKVQIIDSEIGARDGQFAQAPRPNFRPPNAMQQPPRMPHQHAMPHPVPKMQAPALAWDSFESVVVKTLPDGRYHAEVSYKDKGNNNKKFIFEGNKEEIVQQIQQQKDLPQDKRAALLDALNLKPLDNIMPFQAPWMQGNPFNDPFFKNRGFDEFLRHDPFFNQQGAPFRSPYFQRFMNPQWQQPNQAAPFNQP